MLQTQTFQLKAAEALGSAIAKQAKKEEQLRKK